jgi:hypothetical protein
MSDDVSNAPIFATPPAAKGREFEFGAAENEVFQGLAAAMRFVSVGSIALAVLLLLSALALSGFGGVRMLPFAIGQSIAAAVMIITGVWLRGASRSVDAIVTTQGSDVQHLMSAMAHLGRMFSLQRVVFMAAFAVGALGFVGSVGMMAFFR